MAEDTSEGASTADPSGSATYDESIDEHYIQQLTIESVKYCKSCKHASNEPNPLTAGSHCRSGKYPCYPWWQGTYSRPVGLSCRLCMLAFTLGSFDTDYESIDHMVSDVRNSQTLLDEFLSCVSRLIVLINQNKISAKVRGKKRSAILRQMSEERKRTVHLVESQGLRVKSAFKGIILEQYMKDHPNENPRENGALIRVLNVPGKGRVECILKRVGEAHEVDVELETSLMSVLTEEIDDGQTALRQGQAAARQKEVAKATTELGRHVSTAERYQPVPDVQAAGADTAAGPAAAVHEGPAGGDSDADSSGDLDCDIPPLVSALLSDCVMPQAATPKPKPAASKASSGKPKAMKASGTAASSSVASPVLPMAASPMPEEAFPQARGKGKGKRAKIPTNVDDLLKHEGFYDVLEKAADCEKHLESEIFSVVLGTPSQSKQFEQACRSLAAEFTKRHNELNGMSLRVHRRSFKPVEVAEKIDSAKATMKNAACLCTELSKAGLNWERCHELLASLDKSSKFHTCPAVQIRLHSQRARELVAFGKSSEVLDLLDWKKTSIPGMADEETLRNLNERIYEAVLEKLLHDTVQAKRVNEAKLCDLRDLVTNLVARDCLSTPATQELKDLAAAVRWFSMEHIDQAEESINPSEVLASQLAATRALKAKAALKGKHDGFLKGFLAQHDWTVLEVYIMSFASAAQKKVSSTLSMAMEMWDRFKRGDDRPQEIITRFCTSFTLAVETARSSDTLVNLSAGLSSLLANMIQAMGLVKTDLQKAINKAFESSLPDVQGSVGLWTATLADLGELAAMPGKILTEEDMVVFSVSGLSLKPHLDSVKKELLSLQGGLSVLRQVQKVLALTSSQSADITAKLINVFYDLDAGLQQWGETSLEQQSAYAKFQGKFSVKTMAAPELSQCLEDLKVTGPMPKTRNPFFLPPVRSSSQRQLR